MRPHPSVRSAALLAAALSLTACSGASSEGEADAIRLVAPEMAVGIDPANDDSSNFLRAYGAGESLLKTQADGSVAPELAESAEQTEPTRWTVTLREGVSFWSGAAVDAEAVVASLERSRAESTLGAGLLDGVELEAVDERTVSLTTEVPDPYLADALANYALTIHNTDAYGDGVEETDPAAADLTGPYRITAFETQRSVSLEANPDWWGGDVGAEAVEVQFVPDPQSRAELALAGQADLVQEIPTARAEELTAAGIGLSDIPGATTVTIYFNPASSSSPALGDRRVRRALAMAIDREEVVRLATNGLSEPSPSWLASSPAFPEADEQGYTDPDPERAAELLDEAGWTLDGEGRRVRDGRTLTIRMMSFGAEVPSAEVVQAQWGELGIDVQVQTVESALINQAVEAGDWDTFTQAWTTLGDVPSRLATQIGPEGAANHGDYELPGVAALLERAVSADQAAERDAAVYEINQAIADEVPLAPLHASVEPVAIDPDLEGFVDHPLQYENLIQPEMTVE